jgi:hypothetical protein
VERARDQALDACARAVVVHLQIIERIDDGPRQTPPFLMK